MALPIVTVDLVAVLAAAIVGYIVGFIWYGPLFGKAWMSLMKLDPKNMKKEGMVGKMVVGFIATVVMTYVLAYMLAATQATVFADALMTGFMIWLGFFAATMLGQVLWEGKPTKLYALNVLHYLVVLLAASAVIAYV